MHTYRYRGSKADDVAFYLFLGFVAVIEAIALYKFFTGL